MAVSTMVHDSTDGRYRHEETVADASTSDPVLMPSVQHHDPYMKPVVVYVSPAGGGSAKIEQTISSPADVAAGSAVWSTWALGEVSVPTSHALWAPMTALRCVSVNGATFWSALR